MFACVCVCVGGLWGWGVCHLISTKIRPSPNHHHLLSSFFLLHPYIPSSLSGRLTVLFRLRIRYRFFDFGFNFNCSMLAESRKIYIVLRLHCISFFLLFFSSFGGFGGAGEALLLMFQFSVFR